MYEFSLRYALDTQTRELKHIDDVANGIDCNCICPRCNEPLIARNQGDRRAHHFAHYEGSNCSGGYETSLHLLAKRILFDSKRIRVPGVDLYFGDNRIFDDTEYDVEYVDVEKAHDNIVPDLTLGLKDRSKLFVEIYVTHDIDEVKREKVKTIGISTVEIDLSDLVHPVDEKELQTILSSSARNQRMKWIYHREAQNVQAFLFKLAEQRPVIRRGLALHIDDCPRSVRMYEGMPYANVLDDCLTCPYMLSKNQTSEMTSITCLGDFKDMSIDDIRSIHHVETLDDTKRIVFKDRSTRTITRKQSANTRRSIFQIWQERNPLNGGLVVNLETGYAVYFSKSPLEQYRKYGKIYGSLYIKGKLIGNREIYGASDRAWVFKEKQET